MKRRIRVLLELKREAVPHMDFYYVTIYLFIYFYHLKLITFI